MNLGDITGSIPVGRPTILVQFHNYGLILKAAHMGGMDPAKALFTIPGNAVYFPVMGESPFLTRCKADSLEEVSRFLDWLVDAFRFIDGLNLDRVSTIGTVLQEMILSLGVDPMVLLMRNRIVFVDSAPKAEQMVSAKNKGLAERCRKGRLAESANQD